MNNISNLRNTIFSAISKATSALSSEENLKSESTSKEEKSSTTETNLETKLNQAESDKKAEDKTNKTTTDQQDLGKLTDDIMMSDETQEKMISIFGTDGDDNITTTIDEETGNIILNINGKEQEFTPEEAANGFKITLGDGNDSVDISALYNNFVIDAGEGDNNLNLGQGRNIVTTGDGNNNITADKAHRNNITTGNGNNNIDINGDINTVNTGKGQDNISVAGNNSWVNAGAGNDNIETSGNTNYVEAGKGDDNITANGRNDTIYGGKGNDNITAGNGNNTIYGEQGKDNINVGNGKNYIDGGKGNDTINAGNGRNDIYGRDGNDKINAGDGDNYIEGGKGNDNINAGKGNNVIYGLDGNDNINAGDGDNYIDGGKGKDNINAGDGRNIIFGGRGVDNINTSSTTSHIWDDNFGNVNAGAGSQVNRYNYFENLRLGSSISVKGDDDFKMRVESDLESYKHLQTGQKMLSELDNSGHKVTIQETKDQNGYAAAHDNSKAYVNPDGTRGEGTDSTISYNPSFRNYNRGFDPLTILYHEMAHSYDNATGTKQPGEQIREDGTSVNKREQQAVGLEIEDGIEVEHPDGTVTTGNPELLTENAIRNELGIPERTRY